MKQTHKRLITKNCDLRNGITSFSFISALFLSGLFDWPYILLIIILLIVAGVLLAYSVRRRKRKKSLIDTAPQEKSAKPKPNGLPVTKFELSGDKVAFLVGKGFRKKRLAVVREFPIGEITNIEHFGTELSITWKDVTDTFVMEKKAGSFGNLSETIKGMIDEQRAELENKVKVDLRKNELAKVINASIEIADLSFDILISLQEKRVNWKLLESYSGSFAESLNLTGQITQPFSLDLSKLFLAIKNRSLKETSEQTYGLIEIDTWILHRVECS